MRPPLELRLAYEARRAKVSVLEANVEPRLRAHIEPAHDEPADTAVEHYEGAPFGAQWAAAHIALVEA